MGASPSSVVAASNTASSIQSVRKDSLSTSLRLQLRGGQQFIKRHKEDAAIPDVIIAFCHGPRRGTQAERRHACRTASAPQTKKHTNMPKACKIAARNGPKKKSQPKHMPRSGTQTEKRGTSRTTATPLSLENAEAEHPRHK